MFLKEHIILGRLLSHLLFLCPSSWVWKSCHIQRRGLYSGWVFAFPQPFDPKRCAIMPSDEWNPWDVCCIPLVLSALWLPTGCIRQIQRLARNATTASWDWVVSSPDPPTPVKPPLATDHTFLAPLTQPQVSPV